VRVGSLLFVSGQPGTDPLTGAAVGSSFAEQARQAFAAFAELNDLFAEFFPTHPPARMTMQVPLPKGLLISIGCVAAVDET